MVHDDGGKKDAPSPTVHLLIASVQLCAKEVNHQRHKLTGKPSLSLSRLFISPSSSLQAYPPSLVHLEHQT